ncbi:helix-turn-helix transcriptional regulator [Listeria monocytogenes]|nr:helix-turn-helix transcriptional regulator [Listeria monocytogenes]EJF1544833.1 helix-turn-helix transcriptional regulator [Listeria monocytogenes]EJF1622156.1 helix-turn-helix transcriptional regulator [Listeria monocytogenes]EJF3449517.1 helix-turn-helix transcriptional regulator [Listeria monocytogenes]EJF3469481.1 helix-turn-helix transcriptional regulator [Listeria monocytogenes]
MTTFERIKKLSAKKGITISQLTSELEMGENSIYRWKTQKPALDKLQKVADYFNVSIDYLVGRTDNPYVDNDIPQEATTLAAHIDPEATEEDMKKILEYIDFIQQKYK